MTTNRPSILLSLDWRSQKARRMSQPVNETNSWKIRMNFGAINYTFGSMSTQTGRNLIKAYVRKSVRQTCVFPVPARPSTKTECRTWRSSCNWTTRVTKISSGCNFKSRAACRIVLSIVASEMRLSSTDGKRSPNKAKNTGTSSETKRGKLASRRAPDKELIF